MATATKTRKGTTRKGGKATTKKNVAKANKTNSDAAKKKAAQEKAEKAAAREQAAQEKAEAKAQERKDAIKAGTLIEDGDVEFHEVDKSEKKATVDNRTAEVIERLKKDGKKIPVLGKDLHADLGGSWALMIPVFSTLKALGMVREYRRRTGERGGSGVAYLWIG